MSHWPKVALSDWLGNAGAKLFWFDTDWGSIAVTRSVTPRIPHMAYITSLRSHWFDYLVHELGPTSHSAKVVAMLGEVARICGLDRLSLIGNEPISTALRPHTILASLCAVAECEHQLYPDHWIGIRNLLRSQDQETIRALQALGYCLIPTRVVYLFDASRQSLPLPSHLKRDRKLLEKSGLRSEIKCYLSAADCSAITALYHEVYLRKHSAFNADYRPLFFADMVNSGLMQCLILKDTEGAIRAFALLYQHESELVVPAVGHDTSDIQAGYYRQLFAALSLFVDEHRLRLNYSSGAGDFKRKRGGVPELEYTAIKAPQHSIFARCFIKVLSVLLRNMTVDKMIAHGARAIML